MRKWCDASGPGRGGADPPVAAHWPLRRPKLAGDRDWGMPAAWWSIFERSRTLEADLFHAARSCRTSTGGASCPFGRNPGPALAWSASPPRIWRQPGRGAGLCPDLAGSLWRSAMAGPQQCHSHVAGACHMAAPFMILLRSRHSRIVTGQRHDPGFSIDRSRS